MGAKRSLRTIEPRFDTNPGHGEFLGYRDEALGFREGLGLIQLGGLVQAAGAVCWL